LVALRLGGSLQTVSFTDPQRDSFDRKVP